MTSDLLDQATAEQAAGETLNAAGDKYQTLISQLAGECKFRTSTETSVTGSSLRSVSRWSDSVDGKKCGLSFNSNMTVSSGRVAGQGTNTASHSYFALDLSPSGTSLAKGDLASLKFDTWSQSFNRPTSQQEKHRPSLTESRVKITGSMSVAGGGLITVGITDRKSMSGKYIDDNEVRETGSETTLVVVEMPYGPVAYEKTVSYIEKGKISTQISLNGKVIYKSPEPK